ncbi:uncharacterized protein OCT59_019086 [Rhizophagus irregularis]|uniref:uncharacterized protein n=1 Tax=Rhizophagus irregularis TaxID=588596 RepID=UPI0033232440|nr:hypothetical protein OCT59_019086 [Rhizophagus irregularis]
MSLNCKDIKSIRTTMYVLNLQKQQCLKIMGTAISLKLYGQQHPQITRTKMSSNYENSNNINIMRKIISSKL